MSTRDERLAAFGKALRDARDSRGWSQTRLAEEISRIHEDRVTQGAVSYWESGTNSPDIDKVRAAETALGLEPDTLLRVLIQVEASTPTVSSSSHVPAPTVRVDDGVPDGVSFFSEVEGWHLLTDEEKADILRSVRRTTRGVLAEREDALVVVHGAQPEWTTAHAAHGTSANATAYLLEVTQGDATENRATISLTFPPATMLTQDLIAGLFDREEDVL